MKTVAVKKNQTIIDAGSSCNTFYVIADGSVETTFGTHLIKLGKGDVVGIFDITCDVHMCDYIASTDSTLIEYPHDGNDGLLTLLTEQPNLCKFLLNSLNAHIGKIFKSYDEDHTKCEDLYNFVMSLKSRYQTICKIMHLNPKTLPFYDALSEINMDGNVPFWSSDYYTTMQQIMSSVTVEPTPSFTYGYLDKCCQDISHVQAHIGELRELTHTMGAYLLGEDYVDFYDLYCDLFMRTQANGDDTSAISNVLNNIVNEVESLHCINSSIIDNRVIMFKAKSSSGPKKSKLDNSEAILGILNNSVNTILEFADTVPTTAAEFKKYIDTFKTMPDLEATDTATSEVRKHLVRLFNVIYQDVMQVALDSTDIPTVIKMFLNFGFVDVDLCGKDNAIELYKITEDFHGYRDLGIFTCLEWFQAIRDGIKQPSRNEFEQDYTQYVHTLVKEGKIQKAAEPEMLENSHEKILYELNNMFQTVNKITFGRIYTYCPILLESNLIRQIQDLLLTPTKIIDTLDKLNSLDFSAFYHEYIYEDTKLGAKDTIRADIRPDFILMPNAGSRGVMWQEIEGLNRRTPSRMMLSVLFVDNLEKAMIRMIAEYRWEMCKREMGARWNDVTSHSLTSDYCDYVQFCNKNRDLTYEAREKVKEALKRCKNSFKELFIYDYTLYMMYEANGSCRLNKVARQILFQYCPFGREVREKLASNAIFEDSLSKYRIHNGQQLHRLNVISTKYKTAGKDLPAELASQQELLER